MEENKIGYQISLYRKKPKTIAVCWIAAIANLIVTIIIYGFVFIGAIRGCQKIWEIKDLFIYLANYSNTLTIYGFGFLGILIVLGYKFIKWILLTNSKSTLNKFIDAIAIYKYTITINKKDSENIYPITIDSYRILTDDEVMEIAVPKIIKESANNFSKIIFK